MSREVVFIDWCDYCGAEQRKQEASERLVVQLGKARPRILMACPEHQPMIEALQAAYNAAAYADDQPPPRAKKAPETATQPVLEASETPAPEPERTRSHHHVIRERVNDEPCVLCTYVTSRTIGALTMHYREVHGVIAGDIGTTTCLICGEDKAHTRGLGSHMRYAHQIPSVLVGLRVALERGDPHGVAKPALERLRAHAAARVA